MKIANIVMVVKKIVNIVMVVKKIVKTEKNKTPDLGNNQCHLNHCILKNQIIETFCNQTYTISSHCFTNLINVSETIRFSCSS